MKKGELNFKSPITIDNTEYEVRTYLDKEDNLRSELKKGNEVLDQKKMKIDEKTEDETWLEEIAVREALRKLDSREKLILAYRFYEGKTQMEVADRIGISQAQVSRLEKAALKRLKRYVKEDKKWII